MGEDLRWRRICALGLALPLLVWPVLGRAASGVEVDPQVPPLASLVMKDADTLLGLTTEGALLYEQDPLKLSGYQYCSQAVALAESGELRLSVRASSKALHLGQISGDGNLQAMAIRDLAIAFSYAGELDKAEAFAREDLRFPAKEPEKVIGPAYKVIGDVQARRGEHAAAVGSYETALAGTSERYRPLIQASLINALIDSGDLGRARQLLEAVPPPAEPALAAQLQRTEARLLLAERRPAEAAERYRRLLDQPPGLDSLYYQVWAWDGLARSEALLGHPQAEGQALKQALEGLDAMRARFRSEEFRMGLFSDVQSIFERAVDFYAGQGDERSAFETSERSRARAMLDAVRERVSLPDDMTRLVSLVQLQGALTEDERVIEFHVLDDRLLVWAVGPHSLESHSLRIASTDLVRLVEAFRDAMAGGRLSVVPVADQLGKALLGPLRLSPGLRLIVVPHGPLHYLPFQALRLDDTWLIEHHPLSLAPSASIAVSLVRRNQRAPPELIAFGNPQVSDEYELPGATREVRELGALFSRKRLFLGPAATRTAFLDSAGDATLLHLAAHAQADPLDPLHSRILLANEEGRSSFLEVRDLGGVNLSHTALVTLSACESGLGRVDRGDEVQGFSRAFLASGSSALIASLWPVSDEAAERLMRTLYRELARGADLQKAMQAGQLAVLRQPQTAHPFFWAPFNLIGNWRLTLRD